MQDKKTTKKYTVTLVDGADKHVGKGKDIYEALSKVKPFNSKKLVTVTIEYDGKVSKIPLRLNPLKVRRLFLNETDRQVQAKRLQTLV